MFCNVFVRTTTLSVRAISDYIMYLTHNYNHYFNTRIGPLSAWK